MPSKKPEINEALRSREDSSGMAMELKQTIPDMPNCQGSLVPTSPMAPWRSQSDSSQSFWAKLPYKKIALAFVFIWFMVGGLGHFIAPYFFLKIIPPTLPLRLEAVYLSGFFELLGAVGLLYRPRRKIAGLGLILLTIAVTPANVYMWLNPSLFPNIAESLLAARLFLQVGLLVLIWMASRPEGGGEKI